MTPAPSARPSGGRRDPYAPFRPRRGRIVALACAVAFVAAFGYLAVVIPSEGTFGWGFWDRVLLVLFALAVAAGLYRYAALRAIPSREGLRVVNLVQTHDLEWAQIASVGFSGGMPWVVLELTDTEEVAVMAIQRADGEVGRAEARRLSALVAHHTGGSPG
ncbi:PH domain-containing protein [Ornithinicoccus hortensis]|uniref:PH (Pleckstrin Homology) domain-containing protein n=1 Tax=Ornithinicoccus hortensis TaxID=82346 RepID=A0A542YSI0_9MICO|nr:PH domain-containing protein [Ornithinicoccus hortensis]TQL51053.1 PH (Pleckstrin Homology) domain-containing protein [Ornithinicoccus hortensis]